MNEFEELRSDFQIILGDIKALMDKVHTLSDRLYEIQLSNAMEVAQRGTYSA